MCEILEDSLIVLSSMSPRIQKNLKKTGCKKISKLALKTRLRRSSIYDKLEHVTHNNMVVSCSDTTETCSSSSKNSEASNNHVRCDPEIITKLDERQDKSKPQKLNEIKKWITEVNAQQAKREETEETASSNISMFGEISVIMNDKVVQKNANSSKHLAVNSTFVSDKKNVRFDEMFQQRSSKHSSDADVNENRNLNSDRNEADVILINDSYDEARTPIKSKQEVDEHEKLLDQLYGNSWRANKELVLTRSEPRQKKKVTLKRDEVLPYTERKAKESMTYKNPYLIGEIKKSENLLRTLHSARVQMMIESPWATRLKEICDTDSSTDSLNINSPVTCKTKLFIDDSDIEDDIEALETGKESNRDRYINKTPRNRSKYRNTKENMNDDDLLVQNRSLEINEADGKDKNENEIIDDSFCSIELDKIETLEERLMKKRNVEKQKDDPAKNTLEDKRNKFEDVIQSLEDELRNGLILNNKPNGIRNKRNDKTNVNETDFNFLVPPTGTNITSQKRMKGKRLINSETNSKTNQEIDLDSPSSLETKLRNILKVNSKKPNPTPTVHDGKKIKEGTNQRKNDDRKSKRAPSKKDIKYIESNSDESDDSSDDYRRGIKARTNITKSRNGGPLSFLASLSASVPVEKCDASARIYRNTYKTCKGELAKKLFDLYNEKIFDNNIPKDVPLEWNERMHRTAGLCYCKRIWKADVVSRSARIVLATKILDSADRLRDTLVHEMCHAATWIVNEIRDGHGKFWKAWAAKAMKIFPELPPIKRCHAYAINTKYTYKCTDCGYSIGRHSKSLDIERKRCGYCYGKFEIFINKTKKDGSTTATPVTPKKELTGFALFVKENYGVVKRENTNHAEVMKILGKKFSELKTK